MSKIFSFSKGLLAFLLLSSIPLRAQDTGECTITINGQTVFVGPFGSRYRATNIPAGQDWVRACIICTRDDGTVLYGQTDYFEIVDSQTFVMIDDFSLSPQPPAMIRSIRTIPATDVVQGLGQTTQMTTTATLSDDSQSDVTQRIRGTTYRTSNAEIATVSRNGLVTGLRTGIALITATNEGVTSVARVIVTEADEPTSVEGFVQDQDGNPVAGAIVTIPEFGFQTTSDDMGRFTIPGVPSSLFDSLSVNVRFTGEDNILIFGRESGLEPKEGGLTDAGFITIQPLTDGVFPSTSGVLAHFEFEGDLSDLSGNNRDALLIGGEYVDSEFGQSLHILPNQPTGIDWSSFANFIVHPYTIEMVLTPKDTTAWRKLFSFSDANDWGWYYRNEGVQAFPNPVIGGGQVQANLRHYIAFVSTAADQVDVYFQGGLLGSTNASFTAPPSEAIFFRDESGTNRSEQLDAIVDGLRISEVTRTPGEIALVQQLLEERVQ